MTRAILKDAPIVFLDEPSNNLDNLSVTRLKNILLSWANKNKLVLVITHDKRLIDERFDKINLRNKDIIKICNRKFIGCDQLIIIREADPKPPFILPAVAPFPAP